MQKLPSNSTMYKALLERDSAFEGLFYVGVKSTGIFCRPTCPARKPKAKNVEFFKSSHDALYAGYRACLRCHPMETEKKAPSLVENLCALIEKSPDKKIRGVDLKALGIDPSTARRQFQRYYSMTFQAYQRARRMGLALSEIREGKSVIDAQLNSGFESASGFYSAFKQLFGTPATKSDKVDCLMAKWLDTPLGPMIAMANDKGLCLLEFVDRRGLENEILHLRKKTKSIVLPGDNKFLTQIENELKLYFKQKLTDFNVPLIMFGSEFENAVWNELLKIPSGETRAYSHLAEKLNKPGASRAIGRANGKNCMAIIIPCHRVIRANGELSGYGGGVWRKKWLIDHEQSSVAAPKRK